MQTSVLSDEKYCVAGTALTHEDTTLLSLGPPHT